MFRKLMVTGSLAILPALALANVDEDVETLHQEALGAGYLCQMQSLAHGGTTYVYVSTFSNPRRDIPNVWTSARLTVDEPRTNGETMNLLDDRTASFTTSSAGWSVTSRDNQWDGEYRLEATLDRPAPSQFYQARATDPLHGYWRGTCQYSSYLVRY